MRVENRTESAVKSPKTARKSTLISRRPDFHARRVASAADPQSRAPCPHHPAISRTLRCNLQQSRYNSPMCIAHDDDIGARE